MKTQSMCADCHELFMIGKKIVEILAKKKPESLGELYEYLDHPDV